MQKAIKYGFGAIVLYIMVAYTGGVKLVQQAGSTVQNTAKTLQGRST